MKCVARFSDGGGSLNRRKGGKVSEWVSKAGNLAVPNVRKAVEEAVVTSGKETFKTAEEKLGHDKGYYTTSSIISV